VHGNGIVWEVELEKLLDYLFAFSQSEIIYVNSSSKLPEGPSESLRMNSRG